MDGARQQQGKGVASVTSSTTDGPAPMSARVFEEEDLGPVLSLVAADVQLFLT